MEIISIPIIDYLKLCKNLAAQRGFKWVMVLLARERDAIKSFEDIKKYWDSYDDLTAEHILFIFSIANKKEDYYDKYPALEEKSWVRAYNSNLMVMNEQVPVITNEDIYSRKIIQNYRNIALSNHTQNISDLCREYDISESKVPAILLFPLHDDTGYSIKNAPLLIPLKNDDLYCAIKHWLSLLDPYLKDIHIYKDRDKKISIELNEIDKMITNNALLSHERRYLRAKTFLQEAQLSIEEQKSIETAIRELDLHICKKFAQPLRGHINQILNLLIAHKDIENVIEQKNSNCIDLYYRKSVLEKKLAENKEKMSESFKLLDRAIIQYKDILDQEECTKNAMVINGDNMSLNDLKTKNIIYIPKK